MKKIMCYIALVLLVALIAIPPLVRVLYKEPEAIVEKDKFELLVCTRDTYSISTSYKNNIALNVKFKRLKTDPNLEELTDENRLEYYLNANLEKTSLTTKEESVENGLEMTSYFLVYETADANTVLEFADYRYSAQEQMQIYINDGYTCNIIG